MRHLWFILPGPGRPGPRLVPTSVSVKFIAKGVDIAIVLVPSEPPWRSRHAQANHMAIHPRQTHPVLHGQRSSGPLAMAVRSLLGHLLSHPPPLRSFASGGDAASFMTADDAPVPSRPKRRKRRVSFDANQPMVDDDGASSIHSRASSSGRPRRRASTHFDSPTPTHPVWTGPSLRVGTEDGATALRPQLMAKSSPSASPTLTRARTTSDPSRPPPVMRALTDQEAAYEASRRRLDKLATLPVIEPTLPPKRALKVKNRSPGPSTATVLASLDPVLALTQASPGKSSGSKVCGIMMTRRAQVVHLRAQKGLARSVHRNKSCKRFLAPVCCKP